MVMNDFNLQWEQFPLILNKMQKSHVKGIGEILGEESIADGTCNMYIQGNLQPGEQLGFLFKNLTLPVPNTA